jgi:predicted Zn-dependent protease
MFASCSERARLAALPALALALACASLSVPEEKQLAARFDDQVRQQYRFVYDPVINDYVDHIGRTILQAAGPQPFEYRFSVVYDDEINAFAGPAGHIYVHTGTILKARNVSELAGVIGHEIGHVAKRHVAQNYGRYRTAQLGHEAMVVGAGVLAGSAGAGAANLVGGLGMMAVLNSFGREAEREADDFAVAVLPRAGYDPHGLPDFFETLIAEGGGQGPEFLSSHPAPEHRLEDTRAAIARESLPPGLRVDDGGRLEIIQRRIQLLEGEERPARSR